MKKLSSILIILMALLLPSSVIGFYDVSLTENYKNTENVSKKYLIEKNKSSTDQLTYEEQMELYQKVHQIKLLESENYYSTRSANFTMSKVADYYGDIFITMDNKTSSFRHGHAGIGVHGRGAVVEADPEYGVKKFDNRIADYWAERKTGGLMRVHDASLRSYELAQNYAMKMVGKRYGMNPFDTGDFYCSELVYYAWKYAGFDIASGRGSWILPINIIEDEDTYYVQTW